MTRYHKKSKVIQLLLSALVGGATGMILGNLISFAGSDAQVAGIATLTSIGAALGVALDLILITSERYWHRKD